MVNEGPDRPVTEIDARRLRALAHPLRMKILNVLWLEGAVTSTMLAGRLGESTGTLSWHLRQLAASGLLEEDVERGTARERWWRAPAGEARFDSSWLPDDPVVRDVLSTVLAGTVANHFQLVSRYWARVQAGEVSGEWVAAATMMGAGGGRMSPRQLQALNEELLQVLKRHRAAAEAAPEPGRLPVVTLLYSFPVRPDDEAPTR